MVAPPPVMAPIATTGSVTQTVGGGATGRGAYFGGQGQILEGR